MNAFLDLFDYSVRHVAPQDVADFCPSDPGYDDYVRVFNEILTSKTLPTERCFEISETVELTMYANAEEDPDPSRFRRFRVFTNAIAIALAAEPNDSASIFVAGIEFLNSLHEDALVLDDPQLTTLVEAIRALPEWAPELSEDA